MGCCIGIAGRTTGTGAGGNGSETKAGVEYGEPP
jgi:hypothetical protein